MSNVTANLSIGARSPARRLRVKTSRRYDGAGLLEPARIDVSSGYPCYRPDLLATARIVSRLRSIREQAEKEPT